MKKIVCILGLFLFAGVILVTSPCWDPIYALDGCCKERSSTRGKWRANGDSFKQCKKRNASRDRDNIFKKSGKVWWDVACR